MTVYVDDMYRSPVGKFGRMKMSHMIADSDDELLSMATKIGVPARWHQNPGQPDSHFDIAMTKRVLALAHGAVAISWRELAIKVYERKKSAARLLQNGEKS